MTAWRSGHILRVSRATTKSGTNDFHGTVWDRYFDDRLNANTWTNNCNNVPRPTRATNNYGFNATGPIWVPKVFARNPSIRARSYGDGWSRGARGGSWTLPAGRDGQAAPPSGCKIASRNILAVISYNLLVAMKRLALPPELLAAQPKRLRSVVFNLPRRLIWHACRLVLRMVRSCNRFSNWRHAWGQLPLPSPG